MTNIALLRVDDRLVHGQVVTKWIGEAGAKEIVIVDDYLATNTYLSSVFKMAAPHGVEVVTYSSETFVEKINSDSFGEVPLLVLFKSIEILGKVYSLGFKNKNVQIGGIGANSDRKIVFQSIALSESEAQKLKEIQQKGVKVIFQRVPDEKLSDLSMILKKKFKNLI